MQLVKSPQTIAQLSEFDDFFKSSDAECWKTESGNINLYCFSAFYPTVNDLEQSYKELRDHIAISFQGKTLQSAAERWNLYLLLLVKETVPEDVKQRVVHDKFSTRKIVFSTGEKDIDEKYVSDLISSSLLNIEIKSKPASTNSLDETLQKAHPKIAAALTQIPLMNNRDNLPTLIELLS